MEQIIHSIGAHKATNLLPHLSAFVAVVEAGSFTGAAKRAGVDKTLLSRRVRALEDALEVRLLHRTTRSLHVTDAGQALVDAAAGPLHDALQALQIAAAPGQVTGRVRIATITHIDEAVWAPVIGEVLRSHPGIELDIDARETLVNVVGGGFDLAIRTGNLPDSSMIMRRLATWRYVLCATPEWVEAHPEVRSPADLAPHWLLYGDVPNASRWRFERGDDQVEVEMGAVVTGNHSGVLIACVHAGLGVTAMTPYVAGPSLEDGRLVRVLPDWRIGHTMGIYAVTPHRAYLPARVQVVLEMVERRLEELEEGWTRWSS